MGQNCCGANTEEGQIVTSSDGQYVVAHSRSESNIVPLTQVLSQHGSNKALETFVSIKEGGHD